MFYRRDITTNCGPDDEIPPNRVNTTQNLADLRDLMVQYEIEAYYVPLDEVGRRKWISGFSGSNGDVIVTLERVRFVYIFSSCLFTILKLMSNSIVDFTEFFPMIIRNLNLREINVGHINCQFNHFSSSEF